MQKSKAFPSFLTSWLEGEGESHFGASTVIHKPGLLGAVQRKQNPWQESRLSFLFIEDGYPFCKGRSKKEEARNKKF